MRELAERPGSGESGELEEPHYRLAQHSTQEDPLDKASRKREVS